LYITAAVYGEQDRHLQQQTNAPENKRYFIENKGQWDSKVLYLVRLENLDAWITRDGVVYDYYKIVNNKEGSNNIDRIKFDNPSERDFPGRKGHIFQMQYLNNQIPIEITDNSINGSGKQETYYNYFIGNDSSHWASNVSLYKEILITGVYDNIDVRYYIEDKTDINDNIPEKPGIISHLRYDFIVHPGADPSQINIIFNGQDGLIINPAGELVIGTSLGDIKQSGLTAYQDNLGSSSFDSCGSNHYDYENKAELYLNNPQFTGIIPAGFIMLSDKTIGFSVGNYDRTKDLTIDPLIFSTFIGSGGEDCAFAMTIDNSGCSYITGYTSSTTYPRTYGAYDQSYNGGAFDIFVSKLSSAGTYLVFSTYIGGADIDCGYGITLDGVNNVFITGYTWSSNYPTTPGVYDELFNGGYRDAILTKLNISGTGLMFSTFLGGTGDDYGISTVSLSGNNYIAGSTWSSNFPTIAGSYDISFNGSEDVFLSKMNSTASILTYSTYIGGTGADECHQVVIDPSGCGYITGHTASTNYPTTGDSYSQIYNGGGWDGFLTKFSSTGGELTYSTYLGGIGEDYGFALTIDNSNNPYLTGPTWSGNFPISYGAYDTDYNGGPLDAYICKMNTTGSGLVYSTFIGGSLLDQSYSIDLDNANNAVITGITSSNNDFPVTIDAFDKTFNNTITDTTSYDVFVSKVNSTGSQLLYSTYLGGIHDDESYALAVNQDNTIIVTGITNSIDFPASPGAYDPTFNGGNYDVFVTRLTLVSSSPLISTLGELDFDDVTCTNYESNAFYFDYKRKKFFRTELYGFPPVKSNITN
jgi:hypothetical protein